MTVAPPFIERFSTLAPSYDVVLSDVWGVVHNGVTAYPDAGEALKRFRDRGGTVILVSNSPRPGVPVRSQLDGFGVIRAAYDDVVTSGDVTRALLMERPGANVFHVGPKRDLPIFEGLDASLVPIENADYVVCSGLYDDTTEQPDDYDEIIATMLARKLPMICANPDVVVERGDQLVYCAGAIADRYAARGGDVTYAGKPYRPIYEQAIAAARRMRGQDTRRDRILAIGDSVRTDLKGAAAFGVDCLFVTAGIHAEELGTRDNPDAAALSAMFADAQVAPKLVMRQLAW